MKKILSLTLLALGMLFTKVSKAQIQQDQLGAWYMYFYNTTFDDGPWGVQGDVQFRNWDMGSDLEQLLIRSGLTYKPKNVNAKLTLGYGNITSGSYGSSNATTSESRIYQEALFPVQFGNRLYTNHRFRYEQRFVENQDFRTRYRYNLFLNIPITNPSMAEKTLYLALYNELFINGQRDIGTSNNVEIFDRNRFYSALGYIIKDGYKVQLGVMNQTTDNWAKNQLQVSFHHKF
ncbi:MAG: DUF2490 domain-containing protein [Bacteroidia bacterium]